MRLLIRNNFKIISFCIFSVLIIQIISCAGIRKVSENHNNICEIFREKQKWYQNAYASYQKWRVPIPVMMAIMYHESGFRAKARPPRTTCLFIFPGPRPSSAYGYAQAIDGTWENYKRYTGEQGADRDDFADAIDFVGWYCHISYKQCGIRKNDAYNLYLAYHEGQRGFIRKTYQKKAWLKKVANRVRKKADIYSNQLASCEREFQKKSGGCCLFPF